MSSAASKPSRHSIQRGANHSALLSRMSKGESISHYHQSCSLHERGSRKSGAWFASIRTNGRGMYTPCALQDSLTTALPGCRASCQVPLLARPGRCPRCWRPRQEGNVSGSLTSTDLKKKKKKSSKYSGRILSLI